MKNLNEAEPIEELLADPFAADDDPNVARAVAIYGQDAVREFESGKPGPYLTLAQKDAATKDYQAAGERSLLQDMAESLSGFAGRDEGRPITHRVKNGRRFKVGDTRLSLPTHNDEHDDAFHEDGNQNAALRTFRDRYVTPSETYENDRGQRIDGRELLERHGVVVGSDAQEAIARYLDDAASVGALAPAEISASAQKFGLNRSQQSFILAKHPEVQAKRDATDKARKQREREKQTRRDAREGKAAKKDLEVVKRVLAPVIAPPPAPGTEPSERQKRINELNARHAEDTDAAPSRPSSGASPAAPPASPSVSSDTSSVASRNEIPGALAKEWAASGRYDAIQSPAFSEEVARRQAAFDAGGEGVSQEPKPLTYGAAQAAIRRAQSQTPVEDANRANVSEDLLRRARFDLEGKNETGADIPNFGGQRYVVPPDFESGGDENLRKLQARLFNEQARNDFGTSAGNADFYKRVLENPHANEEEKRTVQSKLDRLTPKPPKAAKTPAPVDPRLTIRDVMAARRAVLADQSADKARKSFAPAELQKKVEEHLHKQGKDVPADFALAGEDREAELLAAQIAEEHRDELTRSGRRGEIGTEGANADLLQRLQSENVATDADVKRLAPKVSKPKKVTRKSVREKLRADNAAGKDAFAEDFLQNGGDPEDIGTPAYKAREYEFLKSQKVALKGDAPAGEKEKPGARQSVDDERESIIAKVKNRVAEALPNKVGSDYEQARIYKALKGAGLERDSDAPKADKAPDDAFTEFQKKRAAILRERQNKAVENAKTFGEVGSEKFKKGLYQDYKHAEGGDVSLKSDKPQGKNALGGFATSIAFFRVLRGMEQAIGTSGVIGGAVGALVSGFQSAVLGAAGGFLHVGETILGLVLSPLGKTGEGLTRIGGSLASSLLGLASGAGGIVGAALKLGVSIQTALKLGMGLGLGAAVGGVIGGVLGTVLPGAGTLIGAITGASLGVAFVGELASAVGGLFGQVGQAVGNALGAIGKAFGEVGKAVSDMAGSVQQILSDLIQTGVRFADAAQSTSRSTGGSLQESAGFTSLASILTGNPNGLSGMLGFATMDRYLPGRNMAFGAGNEKAFGPEAGGLNNIWNNYKRYQELGNSPMGDVQREILLRGQFGGAAGAVGKLFSQDEGTVRHVLETAQKNALTPEETRRDSKLSLDLSTVESSLDRLKTRFLTDLMPAIDMGLGFVTKFFAANEGKMVAGMARFGDYLVHTLPGQLAQGAHSLFDFGQSLVGLLPTFATLGKGIYSFLVGTFQSIVPTLMGLFSSMYVLFGGSPLEIGARNKQVLTMNDKLRPAFGALNGLTGHELDGPLDKLAGFKGTASAALTKGQTATDGFFKEYFGVDGAKGAASAGGGGATASAEVSRLREESRLLQEMASKISDPEQQRKLRKDAADLEVQAAQKQSAADKPKDNSLRADGRTYDSGYRDGVKDALASFTLRAQFDHKVAIDLDRMNQSISTNLAKQELMSEQLR